MTKKEEHIVILGNGIAGLSAAEAIRKENAAVPITMIFQEPYLTYSKPALSKMPLRSFQEKNIFLHTENWYQRRQISLLANSCITELLPEEGKILFTDRFSRTLPESLSFSHCIYALGAESFVPPFQNVNLPGVFTLRTLEDYHSLQNELQSELNSQLQSRRRAVIIGGGAIGQEFAWLLYQAGCQVTILEAANALKGRLAEEKADRTLKQLIQDGIIQTRTNAKIREITNTSENLPPHAAGVQTEKEWFAADFVLISCGIRTNTAIAQNAGIACDRGVLVNNSMETSIPCIYAAGDCIQNTQTATPNPGLWYFAKQSGETAGKSVARCLSGL